MQNLIASLNDQDHRIEAAEILRKLIDRIVLSPNEDKSGLVIDLAGDLAGILQIAKEKRIGHQQNPRRLLADGVDLVAGARFELTTFRL